MSGNSRYGASGVPPSSAEEAFNDETQALRQLIGQVEGLEHEVLSIGGQGRGVPSEVVRFHLRKEVVLIERQIRDTVRRIFGQDSKQGRTFEHFRFHVDSPNGFQEVVHELEELLFALEKKRLERRRSNDASSATVADIDPLTDLYSGRLLRRYLEHEIVRSQRTGNPLGLVLFRIPNWPRINRLYAAVLAQEIIVSAACACKVALRGYDYPARTGDAEFAAVLPEANSLAVHLAVRRIASQFRAAMQELLPANSTTLAFECSVAIYPFDADTISGLFDFAKTHWQSPSSDP